MKKLYMLMPMVVLLGCSATQGAPEPAERPVAAPLPSAPAAAEPTAGLSPTLFYHLMLAELAGQRGQLDVAVENYLAAARLSRDPRVAERAARIAVFARDDANALAAARLWVELTPENLEARQVVAALLVRAGLAEEALPHLKYVIQASGPDQDAYMLITSLLGREQDKQAALQVMNQLVRERPDDAEAVYALGHLALLVGELDQAMEAAERAEKLRPGWRAVYMLKAGILSGQGKAEQALDVLKAGVAAHPEDIELRAYYAGQLIELQRLDAARAEFAKVLERAPDHADSIFALGLLALQQRQADKAEGHFRLLLKTGQRVDESAYFLGQIDETRGRLEPAMRWYGVVRQGPYLFEAQLRMAVLLARQGDIEAAREQLSTVEVETAAMMLRVYLAEGEILRHAKRHDEAFELYTEGLTQMPDNHELLYARALTAEALGRLDVLEQDLRIILASDPDNAHALNALGYTLADRTDRYDEALKYVSRAIAIKPDDAAIIDSMGWVQYRMGNHTEALKYLRRAYDMMKDAEIAAHLGEVLWVSGDRKGARAVWNEALKDDPEHELLLEVIQRLTR